VVAYDQGGLCRNVICANNLCFRVKQPHYTTDGPIKKGGFFVGGIFWFHSQYIGGGEGCVRPLQWKGIKTEPCIGRGMGSVRLFRWDNSSFCIFQAALPTDSLGISSRNGCKLYRGERMYGSRGGDMGFGRGYARSWLGISTVREIIGTPGRYRRLRSAWFRRLSARVWAGQHTPLITLSYLCGR